MVDYELLAVVGVMPAHVRGHGLAARQLEGRLALAPALVAQRTQGAVQLLEVDHGHDAPGHCSGSVGIAQIVEIVMDGQILLHQLMLVTTRGDMQEREK